MLYNLELTDDAFPKAEIRVDSLERQVLMPKCPSGLGGKKWMKGMTHLVVARKQVCIICKGFYTLGKLPKKKAYYYYY